MRALICGAGLAGQTRPVQLKDLYSMESTCDRGAAVEVDVVGLFRDLVRLETELWNRVDARVHREHGLPLAWLEVMQVVSTTPNCRVLDVSDALFITVGGASKVVDKVQAGGWCRRLPNPSDGRSSLIELTDSDESMLESADVTV